MFFDTFEECLVRNEEFHYIDQLIVRLLNSLNFDDMDLLKSKVFRPKLKSKDNFNTKQSTFSFLPFDNSVMIFGDNELIDVNR